MRKSWLVVGGVLALLVAGSVGAGAQDATGGASARAVAIKVVVPGQSGAVEGSVAAPPQAVAVGGGFAYPGGAPVVTTGALTASASTGLTKARANAEAASEVQSFSLFGGEVSAARIVARVAAKGQSARAEGSLAGTAVEGLVALGQAIGSPRAGSQITLGDWGYAVALAQGATPSKRGYRGFVTALEIHLTAERGGLPAGTVISVGFAEAAVTAPEPPPPPKPKPKKQPPPAEPEADDDAKDAAKRPRKAPRRAIPPNIDVKLTPSGYVFPVFGPVSFTDTFGADRAVVGWHHGEDIFAPLGAPVLAVANGTVFSVGWNDLGGNRLWLRDDAGNEFYYAHLAAFSPLAVDGRRVRAGDVLGFVGNTGDAETTPPHLHFEIHPKELLGLGYDGVISPYEYLLAWRRLEDVRFEAGSAWLPTFGPSSAPEPGAYLLSARDISSLSGLDPGSLRRALAAPQPSAEAP